MSIYENVIAGYILNGIKLKKSEADELVEETLRKVSLWDEVKDRLKKKGNFFIRGSTTAIMYSEGSCNETRYNFT
jgi:phosphate transport system ATP-binding protein